MVGGAVLTGSYAKKLMLILRKDAVASQILQRVLKI